MTALHRHQLALLTEAGWRGVLDGAWDAQAQDWLGHWARQDLPLVVTRQLPQVGHVVCLGLPAPGRWDRRRIALAVPRTGIARFGDFPEALQLMRLLPAPHRVAWRALCAALSGCGVTPRVHGSHGWQWLTGLDHLRAGSDIDLCIPVDGPAHADAVVAVLQSWPEDAPRLDGELMLPNGDAVAWREWCQWRAGRTPSVLVKRLDGVALAHALAWDVAEIA